jgi:hypothetical protein
MVSEALRLNRKAIGVDINPVAIFITKNTIKYLEPEVIFLEYKKIEKDIKDKINSLYLTYCRKCEDNILPAICFTWNEDKLVDVRYECPHHGKTISKINESDNELYNKINKSVFEDFFNKNGDCIYWYPKNKLYYKDGTPFLKKEKFNSVDELFTKRNLIALALLLDRINKIKNEDLRESFRFAFSSLTHLASKMTPVRPSRPFSSAWVQQSYWYCPNNMESNVWSLFERAVTERQSLIKAKEDLPENFKDISEATNFTQLKQSRTNHYLLTQSAIDALDEIEENSIDYVITDPPYGHSIQYGELLYMWGSWLNLMDDFDNFVSGEIIENSRQNKTEKDYENMLYVAFRKIFKVLKPGKFCTITFHNPDLKYRNILYRSVIMAGFNFEKIVYQPPPRPSAKSLLQPYGSLEGDYFFRFKKSDVEQIINVATIDQKRVEILIVDIAKKIIAERGEPTHYTFIQNSIDPILYEELRKYGLLMDFQPKSIEKILKKHIGEVFTLVDMEIGKQGQKSLLGKGWWFAEPEEYMLNIPLNKRVDEAIYNILKRERRVTFTEVLTEVYTRFQNSLTPDENTIKEILEENAIKTTGGKWLIKPFIDKAINTHETMIYYLSFLGKKMNFKVDVAKDEYGKLYKEKRLDNIFKFDKFNSKNKEQYKIDRINNIDVIWHDGQNIISQFEVEHSTSITDAIIRGANIKSNEIKRFIVIPEEREDLVFRKFNEPAIKSIMKDMEWQIITYKKLESYYENSKEILINFDDFISTARTPLSDKQKKDRIQKKLI